MPKEQNNFKGIVLEFLDYLRYKVENDKMTMEDLESLAKTMECNLNLCGTSDDFARFYGKSKTNVTTVIDRKMLSRPKRMVMHSTESNTKLDKVLALLAVDSPRKPNKKED